MGEWTDGSNWDYGTNISRVGVYPWAMGQPDVWYDNHEQHCVTFWIENNWLWDNLWCNTPQYFFCKSNQTQYPTIQPTLSPTTYSFEPTSTEETSSSKRKRSVAHINSNDINIEPGLQTKQSSYPPLPESLPRLKTLDSFKQNPLKFKRTVSSSEDMYVNKPKEVNTPTDGDDV